MKNKALMLTLLGLIVAFCMNAKPGDPPAHIEFSQGKVSCVNSSNCIYVMDTLIDRGSIYLVGEFMGTVVFGLDTFVSQGASDFFLAKYTTYGRFRWATVAGGPNAECGFGLSVDLAGNVCATGMFKDSSSFYENPFTGKPNIYKSVGGSDIIILKYNANGENLWGMQFGSKGNDMGHSITTDQSGNIYLFGTFADTLYFGDKILVSDSATSFLVKLNPVTGERIWVAKISCPSDFLPFDLHIENNLVVATFAKNAVIKTTIDAFGLTHYTYGNVLYNASYSIDGEPIVPR